jgi:hypothetical protein
MVRKDHLPVSAIGNIVLGCLSSDPIIGLPYADVQKRPFVKAAVRLEWAFAVETVHQCAKYPRRWFPYFTHKKTAAFAATKEKNSE